MTCLEEMNRNGGKHRAVADSRACFHFSTFAMSVTINGWVLRKFTWMFSVAPTHLVWKEGPCGFSRAGVVSAKGTGEVGPL